MIMIEIEINFCHREQNIMIDMDRNFVQKKFKENSLQHLPDAL